MHAFPTNLIDPIHLPLFVSGLGGFPCLDTTNGRFASQGKKGGECAVDLHRARSHESYWRKFGGTVDDYNPAPEVFEADGLTPATTESITCEGTTPGFGINCNFGTQGASLTGGFWAEGSIDPTAPYCRHLPTDAAGKTIDKPGTVAIPKAVVELVATDTTGGQNGPFILGYPKGTTCPKVAKVVPTPKP